MDLGATICTPRRPRCVLVPVARGVRRGGAAGCAEELPARAEKPDRPLRYGVAFWLTRADGAVLLRRRPETGLLGGMIEIPSTAWRAEPWTFAEAIAAAPARGPMVAACPARSATASPISSSNSRSWRDKRRGSTRAYGARSTSSASMRCRP